MDINHLQKNEFVSINTELNAANDVKTSAFDFRKILDNKINEAVGLKFSGHASTRLSSRELNLSDDQMKRVEQGVENARQKGVRDSLVLCDNIALVVNIKNRTVITAMPANQEKDRNVFTNIDGAVIV